MAEEQSNTSNTNVNVEGSEVQDRGLFDFMGKKEKVEEKPQETPITTEIKNLKVADEDEEKKRSLLGKLHQSDSNTNVNVEGSEVQDRGLFDLGKKEIVEEKPQVTPITTEMENLKVSEPEEAEEKKPQETPITTEMENLKVSEPEEAEEKKPSLLEKLHRSDSNTNVNVEGSEVQDRGLFDFMGKKEKVEEKPQETPITTEMENPKVSEPEEAEKKKPSLLEKLHRSNSNSSSSSSSEEEVEEDGEKIKRKKKKGLKEKITEKVSGDKKEEASKDEAVEDTNIPIENVEANHPEEKKTFMEKIKEKVTGGTYKSPVESAPVANEAPAPAPTPAPAPVAADLGTRY